MKETLQRLEVVKNAIMLEDEDVISLQINKLSQLTLDTDASTILALLQSRSFTTVIDLIENYRQSKMGLVSYEDTEVYGLRLELKMMEAEHEELSIEKISIESILNDFNQQYHHKCGKLIQTVLLYRAKLQQHRAKGNPKDKEKVEAFKEAREDYYTFRDEYEEKIEEPLIELNAADKSELKSAYRKASTLCHPDKVSDEFKEQAGEVFKQLNAAYKAKDLTTVNEILTTLSSEKGFSIFSDTVSDAEKVRLRMARIREKITSVQQAITAIKDDETYQLIESIGDWEVYFNDLKVSLKNQLTELKKALEDETEAISEAASA